MGLIRMFDAAFPPSRPYPGCSAVAGYVGGNTPHVWTSAEWQPFAHLAQLPIWVGYHEADPTDHAKLAAAAARRLGWDAFHSPAWRAIVLDQEAELDREWIELFGHQLQHLGFLCWPYNSGSVLASGGDPAGYSVWLPTWDGVPDIPHIPNVIAAQYEPDVPFDGTKVDLSVVDSSALVSFGGGPRH